MTSSAHLLMLFSLNVILHTHENKGTMDPNQFPPHFNPQGPPNNQQGPWQQQNMPPFPPGSQGPQPPTAYPQHPQQPMSGAPNPQQQQPFSGMQSPRPQHPQGPPAFTMAGTPDTNNMYSPPAQPGGQAPQPPVQPQGQQGPPPFPLADHMRMAPGPHRIVSTPGLVPPGTIQQPQQAQQGTPLSFGGAAGHPGPPLQHGSPHPSQIPLPGSVPSSVHGSLQPPPSVHGSVQPPHPGPFGLPMGGSQLAQNPTQQGVPQMVPPTTQQSMQGPPMASQFSQQSVHGGSPFGLPAQAGPHAGNPAASVHSFQGASAQQAHAMHNRGADMSHDHIEAFNDRFSDMRVKEVIDLTAKHQANYVDPSEAELEEVLKESLRMFDEDEMKRFTKEREHIQAAVLGNLQQVGGARKGGAGGVAPHAKRDSPASSKSRKGSAGNKLPGNDPPGPSGVSPALSKHEASQIPIANNLPDQETAGVAHGGQPAARDVNLDRSRSPTRSPSRPRRHGRRRDAQWEGWSSRPRDGTERWRSAGMYYSSGAYKGGILDNARVRPKNRGSAALTPQRSSSR